MNFKKSFLIILVSVGIIFTGCSSRKDVPSVGVDQIVSNQSIGKETSMKNARQWMQENIVPEGAVISASIDSTISASCPQGDGFSNIKVNVPVLDNSGKIVGQKIYADLQCQTYGESCYLTSDAVKKPNFKKDKCDNSLPVVFQKVSN